MSRRGGCPQYARGMRRVLVGLMSIVLLSACSGGTISDDDLARQKDAADDAARQVVAALVADLGATPAAADSLGRGLYAGCDDGKADEASYFVDTYIQYETRDPATAASQVQKSLKKAGLDVKPDKKTGGLGATRDDITIDVESQQKRGGSAGQNVFVTTGCLTIGKAAIDAFNAKNGRDVKP